VLSTLFCALVFCRGAVDLVIRRWPNVKLLPTLPRCLPAINFLRHGRWAMWFAGGVILVGLGAMAVRGSKMCGIDFTGGEEMVLSFAQKPPLRDLVALAERSGVGEVQLAFQRSGGGECLKVQTAAGKGQKFLDAASREMPTAQLSPLRRVQIGGSAGSEMRWNALLSLTFAMLGVFGYVAVRFRMGFAVGAIVSTVHDVLMTLGLFVLMGHRFSAPVLAAILMVVGYSINDTIVVFDRIREDLANQPELPLGQVINGAIDATLSRTLLTSLTTFFAALPLYIWGAGVVVDFSLIFLLGIIVGTFSSIFIASPIVHWWYGGKREGLAVTK
jgi:SecD/SecF fusion protein